MNNKPYKMKKLAIKDLVTILFACLLFQLAYSQHSDSSVNGTSEKLFSFGLIADVQYADVEKAGRRDYRNSLNKLEKCVSEFNKLNLSFTVTLGDLIDRDYASFDKTLPILGKSKAPVHNVIGNHDFEVEEKFKGEIRGRLKNKNGYFDFKVDDFIFIVLDGTDFSTFAYVKESDQYNFALAKYEEIKKAGLNNAYLWNGGIGGKQFKWLRRRLQKAGRANKKVILFCHWPLLPENGTQLWNNKDVLTLINNHECVVAWIAGHHHAGSYLKSGNIHHLTIKGMVEAKFDTSCGIIEVYPDKLLLRGYGDQDDQFLEFYR
jgi:hypothetical protein